MEGRAEAEIIWEVEERQYTLNQEISGVGSRMDPMLFKAAKDGSVEALLKLLESDPLILERVATTTADTPLHIAAMLGDLDFAKEVLKHKTNVPEYVKELNQHGYSPIHLAAANGHVNVVEMFLEISHELCYLRGKGGLTPLHYASIKGRADTVSLLLSSSPLCVVEETERGETALHIAVRNNQLEALRVLVEGLKRSNNLVIINWKDKEGNTILHSAAARKNHQAIELLLNCNNGSPGVLEVNATNKIGLTALEIFLLCPCESGGCSETERLLRSAAGAARDWASNPISTPVQTTQNQVPKHSDFPVCIDNNITLSNLGSHTHNSICSQLNPPTPTTNGVPSNSSRPQITSEPYLVFPSDHGTQSEVRNAMLVVAILIATATYQAVLSPPGGLQLLDPKSGHGVVAEDRFLRLFFVFLNSAVFHISLYMIVKLIGKSHMQLELFAAIVAMFFTYETGLFIIAIRSGIGIQFVIPTICMPSLLQGLSTIVKMTRVVWKELVRGSQPTNIV